VKDMHNLLIKFCIMSIYTF